MWHPAALLVLWLLRAPYDTPSVAVLDVSESLKETFGFEDVVIAGPAAGEPSLGRGRGGAWQCHCWVAVPYLCWAQAEDCDGIFVPASEVTIDRVSLHKEVASYTVIARGRKGAELSLSTMPSCDPRTSALAQY